MKYRKGFLEMVKNYERTDPPRSEEGLQQFFIFESKGVKPDRPDPYFTHLWDGKAWYEWTLNFYASMWPDNWPGWLMLAYDMKDNPSMFRQLRQRMGFDPDVTPHDLIRTFA